MPQGDEMSRKLKVLRAGMIVLLTAFALLSNGCGGIVGELRQDTLGDDYGPPEARTADGPGAFPSAEAQQSSGVPEWHNWYKWRRVGACRQWAAVDGNGPFIAIINAVEDKSVDPKHYRIQCDGWQMDILCPNGTNPTLGRAWNEQAEPHHVQNKRDSKDGNHDTVVMYHFKSTEPVQLAYTCYDPARVSNPYSTIYRIIEQSNQQ